NDWSEVKVRYRDMDGLGSTTYPIYGFIYPAAINGTPRARANPELTGEQPDEVGALIDAYR
ncbi:hypothetical protein ABTK34_19255, partial [Acinetobacter baumannii]